MKTIEKLLGVLSVVLMVSGALFLYKIGDPSCFAESRAIMIILMGIFIGTASWIIGIRRQLLGLLQIVEASMDLFNTTFEGQRDLNKGTLDIMIKIKEILKERGKKR